MPVEDPGTETASPTAPVLEVCPDEVDFGNVLVGAETRTGPKPGV